MLYGNMSDKKIWGHASFLVYITKKGTLFPLGELGTELGTSYILFVKRKSKKKIKPLKTTDYK